MITINLKDIIIKEIKKSNIKYNDILTICSYHTFSNSTFSRKLYIKIKKTDGSYKNINLNISREEIADLNYYGRELDIKKDIYALNKYLKRQRSLNNLLGCEKL